LIHHDRLPMLDAAGLRYELLAASAQDVIDLEDRLRSESRERAHSGGDGPGEDGIPPFFADYRQPAQINAYMAELADAYPALATRLLVGNSLQGRPIYAMRITTDPADTARPIYVINGCQHAREWISPAVAMWTIQSLLEGYGVDEAITRLVDSIEWHIIPVVNPDGYQYTFDVDRFWRKNRRQNQNGSFGVDLNRNWGYEWGHNSGSSGSPSNEVYRGTAPFSEPETTALASYICQLNGGTGLGDCPPGRVLGLIDLHSYSQLILGAWAWSESVVPPREHELRVIQEGIEAAMTATNGVQYIAGLGVDQLLYEASGTGPDWAVGVIDAPGWTIELRPKTQIPGFVLPPSQIVPTARETFAGLCVHASYLLKRIVFRVPSPPEHLRYDVPAAIGVRVIPFNRAAFVPESLVLRYRMVGAGGPYLGAPLLPAATKPNYNAVLTNLVCGRDYEYFLEGMTTDGELVRWPDAEAGEALLTFAAVRMAPPFGGTPGQILPCPSTAWCPGDANGDGMVDADDLGIVLSLLGATVPAGQAPDFNQDGVIDADDLGVLLSGFGTGC
jgi:hypothetical protein